MNFNVSIINTPDDRKDVDRENLKQLVLPDRSHAVGYQNKESGDFFILADAALSFCEIKDLLTT